MSNLKTWIIDTQNKLEDLDCFEPDLISKRAHLDKCKVLFGY